MPQKEQSYEPQSQLDEFWHYIQNFTVSSPNDSSPFSWSSSSAMSVSSSSPPSPFSNVSEADEVHASTQPVKFLNSTEVELLSHYLTHTVGNILFDNEDSYALKIGIPNLAFSSKPLMSSILALA